MFTIKKLCMGERIGPHSRSRPILETHFFRTPLSYRRGLDVFYLFIDSNYHILLFTSHMYIREIVIGDSLLQTINPRGLGKKNQLIKIRSFGGANSF